MGLLSRNILLQGTQANSIGPHVRTMGKSSRFSGVQFFRMVRGVQAGFMYLCTPRFAQLHIAGANQRVGSLFHVCSSAEYFVWVVYT